MAQYVKPESKYIRRPDGTLLTPGNLPPTDLQRWVMRRKADIVMAVRGGLPVLIDAGLLIPLSIILSREEYLAFGRTA